MTRDEKKQNRKFLNRELPVFAFFLLLSFIFWYLNELGKELEGTINYPVRYINPPRERIVTGDLPGKLEMDLRGPGYSILKMKLSSSRAPVVIDFSKMAPKRLPGVMPNYYLVTSGMIQSISKQLHSDFEIIALHPDTLFFGYDRLVTKRMAVIPDLSLELSEGKKVVVVSEPDSVTVRGPEHMLDTLKGIPTRHRSLKRIEENFKVRVPLVTPEYLEITQKRVLLEVTVTGRPSSIFGLKHQRDN
jgi:hypothetical protein